MYRLISRFPAFSRVFDFLCRFEAIISFRASNWSQTDLKTTLLKVKMHKMNFPVSQRSLCVSLGQNDPCHSDLSDPYVRSQNDATKKQSDFWQVNAWDNIWE